MRRKKKYFRSEIAVLAYLFCVFFELITIIARILEYSSRIESLFCIIHDEFTKFQRQLQEFDAEAENRAPPIDISNLSQLFAQFSTSINRVSSGHNAQILSARM